MRMTRREAMGGLLAVAAGGGVRAAERSVLLGEATKAGDIFQVELQLALVGQAAHAVYYTFGTLNWQRLGLSSMLIGGLWALGVISEIILFAYSARVTARFGPAALLALGGAAGVIRWVLTAFDPGVWLLVLLQCLHAFTFGATHLAAMQFITRAAPARLAVTAQGVYAAVSTGIVIGVVTYASGFAYSAFGSLAFLGMAVLCAAGGACALWLRANWAGDALVSG